VSSENTEIVLRFWETLERDGAEALAGAVPPDSEWVPLADRSQRLRGGQALAAWLRDVARDGRRLAPTVIDVEDHGEHVIAVGSLRVYERDGAFSEVSAAWLYEVRDGAIRRSEGFPSPAEARAAVAGLSRSVA
jgi:ketosteroid isomerase-like protein